MKRTNIAHLGLAALITMASAACGGGGSTVTEPPSQTNGNSGSTVGQPPVTDAEPAAATTAPSTEPPTTVAGDGIETYQDVQPAVVQIIAEGSLRDIEYGQVSGAGSGTGFLISADGIAVTNNHVVTGAATLKVYIGGDLNRSYNATVLGVSECEDLAVIDIFEKDPLPFLEWSVGDLKAGLPVYAAGFPLGDPEFTLTSGIIGKVNSGGDMPWASVDSTIEHDAVIQPGNSGGPLVDAQGDVVAVNYAFKGGVTSPRYQAIRNDLAAPTVEKLKRGDFESLGINGEAFVTEEGDLSGIWVAGVAPGSPASDAGLLPGDIVTAMNGLEMGRDGTKADYCDVIRTSGDKPIDVEVLRFDTQEVLRGEFNGDKELTATISFAKEVTETDEAPPAEAPDEAEEVTGYRRVEDDLGAIAVEVPKEWSDVSTEPKTLDDGTQLPTIVAAPSIDDFNSGFSTPGLYFTRFPFGTEDIAGLVANFAPEGCEDAGTEEFSEEQFSGIFHIWGGCGGTETAIVAVGVVPQDQSFTAILLLQATNDADLAVIDQMFATFEVTG